jgi:hypothetical protein
MPTSVTSAVTRTVVGASAVAPIVSVVMAVVATRPGDVVGNWTHGGSTGLDRGESESHHDGKQRGGDYQSEELFHVGDFLCAGNRLIH